MTASDTTTASVQIDDSLDSRFSRAVNEDNTTKSAVLREAIESYVSSVEGETPSSIESKIEDLRDEAEEIEEQKQALNSSLEMTNSRIRELEERLTELRSTGNVEENRAELVSIAESGGNLRVVHEKTDKVESYRRLAGFDTVSEAISDIEQRANSGDGL